MRLAIFFRSICTLSALLVLASRTSNTVLSDTPVPGLFDVKSFGAKGDGQTLDTEAINRAISAAHSAGGGTVRFPAGTYLSVSIHLQSNVGLELERGATVEAASPTVAAYDPPEPNEWGDKGYQDFGHSHWHDALLWGENVENVAITGPGLIHGKGLVRGERNAPKGAGNKAISLKNSRNVTLRDVSILHGGWFAILATGVDNLTIDNLKIDTNRDGIDVDACRNVRISNVTVNSPFDDGICLKSSYGLGVARATENVTVTNCQVSGYDEGTLLDGTFKRTVSYRLGPTGRIKFGTESNGGFKNVVVSNCVFDYCRGLALEIVDGGTLEDVSISNLTMRDIVNAPIFIRLGNRARGPGPPPAGVIRRVNISDVVVSGADPGLGSVISGIPGHPIEDLRLSNLRILHRGGGTKEDAALEPPENENAYPEPTMFGPRMPVYGLFIRHVKGLQVHHAEVLHEGEDARPAVRLEDVVDVAFDHLTVQRPPQGSALVLRNVKDFRMRDCPGLADTRREGVERESF